MARLEGLEPPTLGFEGQCSIQLSYSRALVVVYQNRLLSKAIFLVGLFIGVYDFMSFPIYQIKLLFMLGGYVIVNNSNFGLTAF